jgi:hypothetical protein
MYFQEDLSCEWPWSIEFRHKHEARKVLFVIPGDENAGNGLQLLEEALGNRQDYFPPRGVHLASWYWYVLPDGTNRFVGSISFL